MELSLLGHNNHFGPHQSLQKGPKIPLGPLSSIQDPPLQVWGRTLDMLKIHAINGLETPLLGLLDSLDTHKNWAQGAKLDIEYLFTPCRPEEAKYGNFNQFGDGKQEK
ncbi:hypothetical protein O181_015037 [Austropuccinia psidii MF-1]|uniref:Uncharacterized protein n=1 Tax=Austropuccinia psidii MF-1 TaxID=1389203 RepID=A0A9Q3C2U6_9BASI|nr:hypothetical protein [Austropuccinia psidii MF-1]